MVYLLIIISAISIYHNPKGLCLPPDFFVRPARTYSNGCKSPSRPDSGKATAESKGVHCEVESEGSFRQTSDPTYRNLISRLMRVDKSAEQDKVP